MNTDQSNLENNVALTSTEQTPRNATTVLENGHDNPN